MTEPKPSALTKSQNRLHKKLRKIRESVAELTTYQFASVIGSGERTVRRWLAKPPFFAMNQVAADQVAALVSITDDRAADTVTVVYQRSKLPRRYPFKD